MFLLTFINSFLFYSERYLTLASSGRDESVSYFVQGKSAKRRHFHPCLRFVTNVSC